VPTKTEAIAKMLRASTHLDLANLYSFDMEVQVNVAQDGGERVEGEYKGKKWQGWTDGTTTWKSFRIPFKANTEPEFTDSEMRWDLAAHAEAIGMTGWDWKNKVSRWVAFDFDAIIGHSDKHTKKLSNEELEKVKKAAMDVDWVTVRKSTAGKGIHLYVFLDEVPTNTHTEHAALARAILGKLSALTGYDYVSKVDTCGGNMWVWARKMKGTDGLTLIKKGSILEEVPANWRDHVKVVNGSRRKNLPQDIESASQVDVFEELTGRQPRVPLDDDHKKLIEYLKKENALWWWDQDNHMLVSHTWWLKKAHQDLQLKGVFDTLSAGKDLNTQNCFAGNTEVMTKTGPQKIRDLVGWQELLVRLPDGRQQWQRVEIKSFGMQKVACLIFGDKTSCYVTENHKWLIQRNGKVDPYQRVFTTDLKPGKTELPMAKINIAYEPDKLMYARGFVYGDGWQESDQKRCTVAFFKNDKDLKSLFYPIAKITQRKINGSYVDAATELPADWKELPECKTPAEALGFILGLASADGFVANHIQIFQSNEQTLEAIRKIALFAGLRAYNIRTYGRPGVYKDQYANAKQAYALSIETYNVKREWFARRDHREKLIIRKKSNSKTVISYGMNPHVEEVFCAIVPSWHNFALANGVFTGNCFMYPNRRGAWSVRRFGQGVQEHDCWSQDASGWTRCYYNREADLPTAAKSYGGLEDTKGAFQFREAETAMKAAQLLGVHLNIQGHYVSRETKLKYHKDGRLQVTIERKDSDRSEEMAGWLPEKDKWVRLYNTQSQAKQEVEVGSYDDMLRHLVSGGEDAGWVIKSDLEWCAEPLTHVVKALSSTGLKGEEVTAVVGGAVLRPWRLVNKPFQSEYPGDREWNRHAAQFKFTPTQDLDNLQYPTWQKILNHCGEGLNEGVKKNAWCRSAGIATGADYLKCWIASMLREPNQPLPYLFFHSKEQNTGKSSFWESISLLLTKGYQKAEAALTSQQGFNDELHGAILCSVEEIDLRNNKIAYNRIKDWVTGRELLIHPKGGTPYQTVNTTHWVQCSNDYQACPIFGEDTRIVMIQVKPLAPADLIPRKQLTVLLEKEAPDFLAEVLNLEIPPSNDRLNLPAIETEDKLMVQSLGRNELEVFIDECCTPSPGAWIKFSDFYAKFQEKCDPNAVNKWTKIRVGKEIPIAYPKGRSRKDAQFYIGNIAFNGTTPEVKPNMKYVLTDGFLDLVEAK
jgi:hypothetical protein